LREYHLASQGIAQDRCGGQGMWRKPVWFYRQKSLGSIDTGGKPLRGLFDSAYPANI
jgi:hypothetical protein